MNVNLLEFVGYELACGVAYEISSVTRNKEHASQRNKTQNIGSRLPIVASISMPMHQRKIKAREITTNIPSVTSALSTDMINMHFCKEKEQRTKVTILQFTSLYEKLSLKTCLVLGNSVQEFRIKKKQVSTLSMLQSRTALKFYTVLLR